MARTTRRDVEKAVSLLAEYIDHDALARRYGAGKLAIDHYNPGDNPYSYKIVWILDANGGHCEPWGSLRWKGADLINAIHFMRNAICGGVLAAQNRQH